MWGFLPQNQQNATRPSGTRAVQWLRFLKKTYAQKVRLNGVVWGLGRCPPCVSPRFPHNFDRCFTIAGTGPILGLRAESETEAMLPIFHQIAGVFLIVTGLVVLPLPIPLGLIMITLGCALLAPYVPYVQRLIRGMRRKWPQMNAQLLKYRHRLPPIMRKTIDKTTPEDMPAE